MRETIQDKVNSWFIEKRHPETGEYPNFPEPDNGGSKVILNPPLPSIASLLEDGGDGKGKEKDKKGGDKKDAKGKKGAEEEEVKVEKVTSIFVPSIEASVHDFVAKWQDRDEKDNFFQKFDTDLVKDELRPIVFEEVRVQVDDEMRVLLQNLKDMVAAEKAAKLGKKVKKAKAKKPKVRSDSSPHFASGCGSNLYALPDLIAEEEGQEEEGEEGPHVREEHRVIVCRAGQQWHSCPLPSPPRPRLYGQQQLHAGHAGEGKCDP